MATAPTQVTQYQTGFAPEIAPYAQNLLGIAAARAYKYQTDASGKPVLDASGQPIITGFQPYQQYTGNREAQFTDLQKQAFKDVAGLGVNQNVTDAASETAKLAAAAGSTGYNPTAATNRFTAQSPYAFTNQGNTFNAPQQYNAGQFNAQQVAAPQLKDLSMQAAKDVGTKSFVAPGTANQYMSPYMQNVVDVQTQEAKRQSAMQNAGLAAAAAHAGSRNSSGRYMQQAEANRNLNTQLNAIQATGSQNAYQNAQQQFNAEQQANLQAALANQGVQQQTGVQNLSAQLQQQGLGAQTGMQAALANQQYGMTAQQLAEQSRQFGAGQGLTAAQAAAQYGLGAAQLNANQQQYGYGQGTTNAQLAAQYGLSADQLNAQQNQYGAGLKLQGQQAGMAGYNNLANIGNTAYNQQTGAMNLQNQYGTQQQQNTQNVLNNQYQNWQNQQNFPYQQMSYMSDMIRGLPMAQQGSSMYQAAPSMVSQAAGLGTAAVGAAGMYNAMNRPYAKGGEVKSKTKAGLAHLLIHNMA